MKVKGKYLIYGILIIIIFPIFIDFFVIGNKFPSNISNSDWVGFLGSYLGSIIGSIATLVGVIITIRFTREQANEDRRLSLAPSLKYNMFQTMLNKKHDIEIFHVIDKDYNTLVNATIVIKNIGMGPLLDIIIDNITFKDKKINLKIDGSNDVIEKDSEVLMLIDLRLKLDEVKRDTLRKNPPGSLVEYSPPIECLNKGGNLCCNIKYRDLMGNQYEQYIKINIGISLECENGLQWKYSKPSLCIDFIGECKIIRLNSKS